VLNRDLLDDGARIFLLLSLGVDGERKKGEEEGQPCYLIWEERSASVARVSVRWLVNWNRGDGGYGTTCNYGGTVRAQLRRV
jgi:hypothetical protein